MAHWKISLFFGAILALFTSFSDLGFQTQGPDMLIKATAKVSITIYMPRVDRGAMWVVIVGGGQPVKIVQEGNHKLTGEAYLTHNQEFALNLRNTDLPAGSTVFVNGYELKGNDGMYRFWVKPDGTAVPK
ncbi:MAG: hypothetical protein KAZ30_00775 [Candidatus Magasanikbacteria bacterium]|nr:hypothetical protein [Candidatus Magasanikbacteria bacterium]